MNKPQNILVRMPNWIGDLVMATPVLADLRRAFPDASITAMCKAPGSDLLKSDVFIDELFSFTEPANKFLRRKELRNITAKIEEGKFDTALLLTNSFSSAWRCWQGHIARRIGYSAHFRRFLLTDPIPWPLGKMHQVDFYKALLEPLGIPRSSTAPRLFLSEEERREAKQRLRKLGVLPGKGLVGINPGAAYGSAKCWPPERFRELAKALAEEHYVIFFGASETSSLSRQICSGLSERVINVTGSTSLRELAVLIAQCDLFVTNDSGPMHIAAALGVQLIALFGSTDDRATGPYGNLDAVINKRVNCSPCFRRTCPIDFRCMQEISVEEVLQYAKQKMQKMRHV